MVGWGSTQRSTQANVFSKTFKRAHLPERMQGVTINIKSGGGTPNVFQGVVNENEGNLLYGYGPTTEIQTSLVNILIKFVLNSFIYRLLYINDLHLVFELNSSPLYKKNCSFNFI